MKVHHCVTSFGEYFVILQNDDGVYLCPVCGSAEFNESPYNENGMPSFQMCSCGFQFGFNDSSAASGEAVDGVASSWDKWRLNVIEKNKHSKLSYEKLERNLKNIGYALAFDLIPVKIDDHT